MVIWTLMTVLLVLSSSWAEFMFLSIQSILLNSHHYLCDIIDIEDSWAISFFYQILNCES